jgi:predicted small secreted protein
MKLSVRITSAIVVAASILTSCNHTPQWTVSGTVANADGSTMLLEAPGRMGWYVMDSVKLSGNGTFSLSEAAPEYPEVYRLSLGGREIYFPIDSIESLSITANADKFDTDYTLTGSANAELIAHVDQRVRQASATGADSLLKRELSGMLLGDPSSVVAYYIIRKQLDGKMIFDPAKSSDLRVIGAVANAYDQFRPNDPRTTLLRETYLAYKRNANNTVTVTDTIYATETGLFDIKLYDNKGVEQSLVNVAGKNKVVILNFTLYTAEASQALNLQLAKAYEQYHGKGLEIYQVAADEDEYAWRQSAANLPWVTVHQTSVSPASHLRNYNVNVLPSTFLIVNGELRERISDPAKVAAAVARVI